MITNLHKNCMGTISFDGQFKGMRKPQEFICYPLHAGDPADRITIQSDTRIGFICTSDGRALVSPSRPSGSYFPHLSLATYAGQLDAAELLLLKAHILASASGRAGSNGIVVTDNSAALDIFGEKA
jgi:hypothetical protein